MSPLNVNNNVYVVSRKLFQHMLVVPDAGWNLDELVTVDTSVGKLVLCDVYEVCDISMRNSRAEMRPIKKEQCTATESK